jgi:hypothetical protein
VRGRALLGAVAATALLAGCGLGTGGGAEGVSLVVTRDFGARTLGEASAREAPGSETVMRFLQRNFRVATRYGGGFVQSIDGLSGGREGTRRRDWFYYVNGLEADEGAAATRLHPGDRVWWDRHDWGAAVGVPAVVGSFPEPFRSGIDGKRLPVQVACGAGAGAACVEAQRRLGAIGAKVGVGGLAARSGEATIRVLVGPWRGLRGDPVARRIERGPATSGVYARFAAGGRRLELLDERGRELRALPRAGLVAATRLEDHAPLWVVTGTDAAGALQAARALTEERLRNRFALALDGTRSVPLPATAEGAA